MRNVDFLDLRDYQDEELLDQLYRDLYLPAFKIPEQLEDPSVWAPALWGGKRDPTKSVLHCIVVGHSLREPCGRSLLGFIMFGYLPESGCGLVTYLAIRENCRRRGLAKELIKLAIDMLIKDARRGGKRLRGVFAEVDDPITTPRELDPMIPEVRLRIFERLGARLVPVRYVQPGLKLGQGRSTCLLLAQFPIDGVPQSTIAREIVRSFLHEFYRRLGVEKPETDQDFARMMADLSDEEIHLRHLSES